jgi:hypothetical protein
MSAAIEVGIPDIGNMDYIFTAEDTAPRHTIGGRVRVALQAQGKLRLTMRNNSPSYIASCKSAEARETGAMAQCL